MSSTLPVYIYYSKRKLLLLVFVSFVFDLLGLWCTTINPGQPWSLSLHPFSKYGLIGILVLIGGLCIGYVYIKKMKDNDPVITIDNEGIKRRKGKTIYWQDIESIEIQQVKTSSSNSNSYTNRAVVPIFREPQKYYSEGSQKLLGNLSEYRTDPPVQFMTTNLNCSTDELLSILETGLAEFKTRH
ncbi:MAG TPA: STM3941 family protein [Mucilaginibacter sp.]|nr:STM3941 family protein [Mucilaginibacter sp.]